MSALRGLYESRRGTVEPTADVTGVISAAITGVIRARHQRDVSRSGTRDQGDREREDRGPGTRRNGTRGSGDQGTGD